jgi:DNA-binding CsgD family transcriptional regulator/DNA-directed RNA polymerase specialized sigma24 family protein
MSATRAKKGVSSPEEVYSHSLLRYLSHKHAEAYITSDDLLQEAALAVWKKQKEGETNPHFLFNAAKWAMLDYTRTGCSIDRTWATRHRRRPVQVQQFDDMRSQDKASPGPDPLETWAGEDEKAGRFPAVVALRDLIERIYAYDGYTDSQWHILQLYAAGLTREEIRGYLGLSPEQYAGRMRRLRIRIVLDALDGRRLPMPNDLPLTQRQKQVYAMEQDGMTHKQIGAVLGIGRAMVGQKLARIQYRAAMAAFGLKTRMFQNANRDWLA